MFGKHLELNEQTMQIIREVGRHMPGGFFIYEAENEEIIYANNAVLNIFGCESVDEFKKLTGNTFKGMVYPKDYDNLSKSIAKQIEESQDNLDYVEYRIVRKDGIVRWVDDYGHYTDTEAYGGIFYVFISDITEKHNRQEHDNAVRDAVIDTLTKTYKAVGLINDVETGTFSLYHGDLSEGSIHEESIKSTLGYQEYEEAKDEYIGKYIAPKDRERMREETSLSYIKSKLSEKDYFSVTFLRYMKDGMRYYRIDFGKVDMPNGHIGVMMGFKDVDDEIRTSQNLQRALESRVALQEKLLEKEKEKKEQDKMITALASDYRSIYYVDLDADDGVCYRADPEDKDHTPIGIHFKYYERFKWYGENSVDEAYREGFLNFIDPDNIRKVLLKNSIIAYRYLVHRDGVDYYEMIRMAGVRHVADRDDNIVHAIGLGLTNIDSEMRDTLSKNQTLREALAVAQEANESKTAFLSNMSHEIRTPMNAIIGLDNLALRKENLDGEVRDYLEKINGSAQHLLSLINDILDMSRIESGRIVVRKDKFAFHKMIEQINTMVITQCNDKGLEYKCDFIGEISDYYIGDDMKLKQILINILSNAIKFTEAPGKVSMTIEKTAEFKDQTTISFVIEDTGIGMDKDFIPKIFETFTQEDSSRNNKYGSTGLGMAITKSLVDILNGTISIESEKGVGTKFTVVFTLKNCKDMTNAKDISAMDENQEVNLSGRHILVAEDVIINAEIVKELLKMKGIISDYAENGKVALSMFENSSPEYYDAILMDIRMPEMDGLEATSKIRALDRPDAKTIPIIAMTANAFDEDVQRSLQVGMNAHLSKPVETDRLYQTLEELIWMAEQSKNIKER